MFGQGLDLSNLLPVTPKRELPPLHAAIFDRFRLAEILVLADLADIATEMEILLVVEDMIAHGELERAIVDVDIFHRRELRLFDLYDLAKKFMKLRGWRYTHSRRRAKFIFGLATKPDRVVDLATDAVSTIERFGTRIGTIEIEPVPSWVFDVTSSIDLAGAPFGQMLVQAFRDGTIDGMSEDGIRRVVEGAVHRLNACPKVEQEFAAAADKLPAPYNLIADMAAEAARNRPEVVCAARESPEGWTPPDHIENHPRIECWWTFYDRNAVEVLGAKHLFGHPQLPNGDCLSRSSSLIWIDERLGWARTASRLYQLGERARGR